MGNRLIDRLAQLRAKRECALICFLTPGIPDLKTTCDIVVEFERLGVDAVELGIPFSDPLCDGTTIQKASFQALKNNITTSSVLDLIESLRKTLTMPIIVLSYYNPIYRYGIENFFKRAGACGVDGIIVPDLPPEEGGELKYYANLYNIATIGLVAPTSPPKRIRDIAAYSEGFIYYVSLTGTTGMRDNLDQDLRESIFTIRQYTDKPICVGFGLHKPHQLAYVGKVADGVIIGSALVECTLKADKINVIEELSKLVKNYKKTLQNIVKCNSLGKFGISSNT